MTLLAALVAIDASRSLELAMRYRACFRLLGLPAEIVEGMPRVRANCDDAHRCQSNEASKFSSMTLAKIFYVCHVWKGELEAPPTF